MRKRRDQPVSSPPSSRGRDRDEDVLSSTEAVSPVRSRAVDQTVQRATNGLIRLESRRRTRNLLRRLIYLTLIIAPLGGLCCYYSDELTHLLATCWEQIASKVSQPELREK